MLPRVIPQLRTTSVFLNVRGLQRSASFHTLSRSVLHPRIAFKNSPYLACVPPCCKHKAPSGFGSPMRGVASSVTNKPGSQTAEQAALNIKEEVSNTAGSVARAIAGANMTIDSVKPIKPLDDSFVGITSAVASSVPKPVLVYGLAGGLPYLATSATVIYLARQAGLATTGVYVGIDPGVALTVLDQALNIQVTYGAVMLSFLGALHWGMEFVGYGGHQGYKRLSLGAFPVLWGWSTLALDPTLSLVAQWFGFTALWWADLKATNAGWTPKWYSQYRFYLSILVGTCIIGTLTGTSHFGPVAGHGFETHDLNELRAERKKRVSERAGTVSGDIEALPADEKADSYVVLKKTEGREKEAGAGGKGEKK